MAAEEIAIELDVSVDDDAMNDNRRRFDHRDETADTGATPTPTSKSEIANKGKKRQRRSKCWIQFTKVPKGADGVEKCQCKHCLKYFTCNDGTGHL